MSEEQEYVAGLAGSEESPTTKRKMGRLKKGRPHRLVLVDVRPLQHPRRQRKRARHA